MRGQHARISNVQFGICLLPRSPPPGRGTSKLRGALLICSINIVMWREYGLCCLREIGTEACFSERLFTSRLCANSSEQDAITLTFEWTHGGSGQGGLTGAVCLISSLETTL